MISLRNLLLYRTCGRKFSTLAALCLGPHMRFHCAKGVFFAFGAPNAIRNSEWIYTRAMVSVRVRTVAYETIGMLQPWVVSHGRPCKVAWRCWQGSRKSRLGGTGREGWAVGEWVYEKEAIELEDFRAPWSETQSWQYLGCMPSNRPPG